MWQRILKANSAPLDAPREMRYLNTTDCPPIALGQADNLTCCVEIARGVDARRILET